MGESGIPQRIQDQSFAERFLEEIEVGRSAEIGVRVTILICQWKFKRFWKIDPYSDLASLPFVENPSTGIFDKCRFDTGSDSFSGIDFSILFENSLLPFPKKNQRFSGLIFPHLFFIDMGQPILGFNWNS